MKTLLIVLFLGAFGLTGNSQLITTTSTNTNFFAQCMIQLDDNSDFTELENSLREIPYVKVARVDAVSSRVFVLTKDITTFSESDFLTWLGSYASASSCIQVGLHGVDQVNPFPFTNCGN
jgi:hypothetical protein